MGYDVINGFSINSDKLECKEETLKKLYDVVNNKFIKDKDSKITDKRKTLKDKYGGL